MVKVNRKYIFVNNLNNCLLKFIYSIYSLNIVYSQVIVHRIGILVF